MAAIMVAMDNRYAENPTGGYLSPATLQTVPGYEHLRFLDPIRFQFQYVPNLNDGVWLFNRAALWFESPNDSVGTASYVLPANNTCGTGAFTDGTEWCGREQSLWAKLENKTDFSSLLMAEKLRLTRTMRKFYQRYTKDQTFTTLANGQYATLAGLVGYAGTAANCGGVFVYNEIPFGCEDLFNYWGIPIVVNRLTANNIVLVNRTLVASSSGQQVRLAEEAKLE